MKTSSNSEEPKGKPHNILEGCLWPDPDPSVGELRVDNVARMDSTPVDRIVFPKNEEEVCQVLQQALHNGQRITVRGTQHCMGGQAIPGDSTRTIVLDTKFLAHQRFDPGCDFISVGPGCQWAQAIRFLNRFGKAPRTMQSYSSFSIGGTLSVNAHGITTDTALVEDVAALRLVCYRDGRVQAIAISPEDELFGLVIGGYGLFGIVTEITLKVTENYPLVLDSITAKMFPEKGEEESEFQRIWKSSQEPHSGVQVKLARLNILTMETASVYLFRKNSERPMVADLPLEAREMCSTSRLLYKWALPLMTEVRMAQEESSGSAMDMAGGSGTISQNELLYESAIPLAKLYSPFAVMEKTTFVLQEFFCPKAKLTEWVNMACPIFRDMREREIRLLNCTIRYVQRDAKTFLNYATSDMFSFVLYYRIEKEQERLLGTFHNSLAQITLELGGTFYLPYRGCYSDHMLQQAYPQIKDFCILKEKYDPTGIFWNSFFQQQLMKYCLPGFEGRCESNLRGWKEDLPKDAAVPSTLDSFLSALPNRSVLRQNANDTPCCYDLLVRDPRLRKAFEEQFLAKVFHIEEPSRVMRAIVKATWDPKFKGMLGVYTSLYNTFNAKEASAQAKATKLWRSLRQISAQKKELTRETCSILHRAGFFGKLRSYVSVGDHGKLVVNMHQAGAFSVDEPAVYVVHDFGEDCESDPACVLERGAMHPVGEPVQYDYRVDLTAEKLSAIPSGSVDLVTINQGLHHIPPTKQLFDFLTEVLRILIPGGLFIIREHDLTVSPGARSGTHDNPFEASIEMLDLAHSVFNAVTGVSPEDEARQIRAFRPVDEWKSIVCSMGFADTMLLEMEQNDPTSDLVLCFQKFGEPDLSSPLLPLSRSRKLKIEEPPFALSFRALLSQIPSSTVATAKSLSEWLGSASSHLLCFLEEQVKSDMENNGASKLFDMIVNRLQALIDIIRGGQSLLKDIQVRDTVDLLGMLSMPEIFLVLPCLKRIVDNSEPGTMENENRLLNFVETYAPTLLLTNPPAKRNESKVITPSSNDASDAISSLKQDVKTALLELIGTIPDLADPQVCLASSGFTLTQQSALLTAFGGTTSLEGFASRLADVCDKTTWEEIRVVLVGNEKPTVQSCRDLPSKELLTSCERNHPWHQAFKAFLKSPRVQLSSRALRALHWIGLPELAKLYEECKQKAKVSAVLPRSLSTKIQPCGMMAIKQFVSGTTYKEVRTVELKYDRDVKYYELHDVGEIVSAEFGYKSLTSNLTDITARLSSLHARACQAIKQRSSSVSNKSVGWLPLHKDELNTMRNSGSSMRAADNVRQSIVGIGSLGLAGGTVLKLSYIPLLRQQSQSCSELGLELSSANALCHLLRDQNVIRGNMHNNDGHFTWFKLCEWMLVDILEKFGASLDHTPWYFFPFIDCLKLYFQVLLKEAKVVCEEYGPFQAYASQAFLTDLVPGVIMGLIFGQLQAISGPLATLFPTQAQEIMVEEIVFHATSLGNSPPGALLKQLRSIVDERITDVECIWTNSESMSLYKMTVPTYRTMGEILINLAFVVPTARILQISGQDLVQVRLLVQLQSMHEEATNKLLERTKRHLGQMDGVDVLFHYRFPCDMETKRMQGTKLEDKCHVALRVSVLSLVSLVQGVDKMEGISIEQIYEVWTGW